MIETVMRKVAPQNEQSTINLMIAFGWHLTSSQEINVSDSHLERRYDEIYSVTTKENYIKLHFQRDTNMSNYARIVELERAYNLILKTQPQMSKSRVYLSVIIAILTIWFAMIPGILFYYFKCYKPFKKGYAEWNQRMNTTGSAILREARQLL